MLKPFFKINPRNHIFMAAGAISGLVALGVFGFIFGLLGGALIDQLTVELRRKKELKNFFRNPENGKQFIEAAAVSTAWYLCFNEPAKTELLAAAVPKYFPDAPRSCIETLCEMKNIDFVGAAAIFGKFADDRQKNNLNLLIAVCVLIPSAIKAMIEKPDGETATILAAAGLNTDAPKESDYALLGLAKGASPDEVKKVYYNLASHFHPDAVRDLTPEQRKMSEDAFKRIKDAYERLKLNR